MSAGEPFEENAVIDPIEPAQSEAAQARLRSGLYPSDGVARCFRPHWQLEAQLRNLMIQVDRKRYLEKWQAQCQARAKSVQIACEIMEARAKPSSDLAAKQARLLSKLSQAK